MSLTRANAPDLPEVADVERLPIDQKASAIFKGTCSLHQFAEEQIIPILRSQLSLSDHEQALVATYYRMTLLLRGLSTLGDPAHFQLAGIVARSLFELVLDIKALDQDPALAAKFLAFRDVAIYHSATQLRDFLQTHPAVDRAPHADALRFASDPARNTRIEQECIKHWGPSNKGRPKWPKHWSGKDTSALARDAGLEYEEIYRSQFFLLSYYVHAGPAGILNLSRDALIRLFGIAHGLIQRCFVEATEIMCLRFKLFVAESTLYESLRRAKAASGFFAVQAAMSATPQ